MASVAIETYQPSEYQALRHLHDAFDSFLERSPQETIEKKMMEIFVKHQVYDDLAVSLIHRHFDMSANEKLVEFGPVSSPWSYRQADDAMMGGSVTPRSWLFKNGKMLPYEFGYNEAGQPPKYKSLPDKPDFYAEFNDLLEREGLGDLLGLTLLTERKEHGLIKVEKTFGRSNVVFTMTDDDALATEKDAVPAQWEYAPGIGDFIVPVKKFLCISGCICSKGVI